MAVPIVLAVASSVCFLGLAHAAVSTPRAQFVRASAAMAAVACLLTLVAPAAGAALIGPIFLSRLLAGSAVPSTVSELLDRYPSPRRSA